MVGFIEFNKEGCRSSIKVTEISSFYGDGSSSTIRMKSGHFVVTETSYDELKRLIVDTITKMQTTQL